MTATRTTAPIGLLQDKIAVITGAGTGIGAVTGELFIAEGAPVLVADIDRQAPLDGDQSHRVERGTPG